ncbi:MAG: TIGR00282 family metallophosphoesterase [Clostridia bacterium]|nr:TIGR00282 family metallophosphoesterase [Clostridia bacterium]
MKVLIVGDVVGRNGLNRLKIELDHLLKEEKIDFCIVNGENSASGRGIRVKEYNEIMEDGADAITMGNHIYYRKEMASQYIKLSRLVIPANVTNLNGHGYVIIEKNGIKFCVINLIGKFGMGDMFEKNTISPFDEVTKILEKIKNEHVDYIFVDFHAEATAEKIAMGYFLEDKVSCVFGTHTHVQTADERISESGMAYITDVGMTGPTNSVIGLKKEIALTRFVKGEYARYECSGEEAIFNAIIVEYDDKTKKAIHIRRINQ